MELFAFPAFQECLNYVDLKRICLIIHKETEELYLDYISHFREATLLSPRSLCDLYIYEYGWSWSLPASLVNMHYIFVSQLWHLVLRSPFYSDPLPSRH